MTIQDAVTKVLSRDELAFKALKKDILNINAYSKIIAPKVSKLLKRRIKVNSVSVALGRVKKHLDHIKLKGSKIRINSLHVDVPVFMYIFHKDESSLIGLLNLVLDKKIQRWLLGLNITDNDMVLVLNREIPALKTSEWQKFLKLSKKDLANIRMRVISDSLEETHRLLEDLLDKLRHKGIDVYMSTSSIFDISIVVDSKDIYKVVRLLV